MQNRAGKRKRFWVATQYEHETKALTSFIKTSFAMKILR